MKAPTYHMDIGSETLPAAACGKKKGLVMEKQEFMKQMKDGFDSLFLCDNCIRIAKSKKNGKANQSRNL